MNRTLHSVLAAALAIPASFAMAQTSGPVAYIYVSSNYSGSNNRVVGYSANASGQLSQISGSPWSDNLYYLATNGTYLYGSTNISSDQGKNIFSYRVESNGALKYLGATNIHDDGSANACDFAGNLLFDHTGSYLYTFVTENECNSETAYLSFAVNKTTGHLNYLGVTNPHNFGLYTPLSMAADNLYAYSSAGGGMYGTICSFKKGSNGALTLLGSGGSICQTPWASGMPNTYSGYGGVVTADPTNHLAMNMLYYDQNGTQYNKIQTIAINTTNGALTSNSTFSNMPETAGPERELAHDVALGQAPRRRRQQRSPDLQLQPQRPGHAQHRPHHPRADHRDVLG